jgi:hypothetical protein
VRFGRPHVLYRQVVARIATKRQVARAPKSIAEGWNGDGVATARGVSAKWPSTMATKLGGHHQALPDR